MEAWLLLARYLLLGLLYLFLAAVVRVVWVELARAGTAGAAAPARRGAAGEGAGPLPRRARLRLLAGAPALAAGSPSSWLVEDTVTMGRDPTCGIVITDPFVSALHARIRRGPEGLVLEDLGSANGTLLNGEAVGGPALLEDGDEIVVGPAAFQVSLALGGDPS